MTYVPVTVLGGLPVIADVWFSGPDYYGEYDSGADALFWRKRDGTRGKELSLAMMERVEKLDGDWQAYVTEQASDWLGDNCPTRYSNGHQEGTWSDEYRKLNPSRILEGAS